MTKLALLINNAIKEIKKVKNTQTLENLRIKYLGKKGILVLEILKLKKLPKQERPVLGKLLNNIKKQIKNEIYSCKKKLDILHNSFVSKNNIDVSLPGRRHFIKGNLHPISYVTYLIEQIFTKIGFSIIYGPEIEDIYHNFDALNISKYHPARNNKDTFWFDKELLLRTQTSSIQIREIKKKKLPIKIISTGKVYRNDYDSSHTPMFHQMEGFIVDKNVNFANLKKIIKDFLFSFFNLKNLKIRFRPSYFPFTEPSAEVDVMNNKGKWIEVLGCGIMHPNILNNVGINSDIYSGLAFGLGIERLVALLYNIDDLRCLFENDLRFLSQFK